MINSGLVFQILLQLCSLETSLALYVLDHCIISSTHGKLRWERIEIVSYQKLSSVDQIHKYVLIYSVTAGIFIAYPTYFGEPIFLLFCGRLLRD